MTEGSNLDLLDHQLTDDEVGWVRSIYADFEAARSGFAGRQNDFDPKETLRDVLRRPEHQLSDQIDLSGDGPWRFGKNSHGRFAACVFLKKVELHRHARSRTDQFAMYVVGDADAFSLGDDSQPILTPVRGGGHFHNAPGAPHAFLPKVGQGINDDWEIAFIAITPRNLKDDTQKVSEETRDAYRRVVGREAPAGL